MCLFNDCSDILIEELFVNGMLTPQIDTKIIGDGACFLHSILFLLVLYSRKIPGDPKYNIVS